MKALTPYQAFKKGLPKKTETTALKTAAEEVKKAAYVRIRRNECQAITSLVQLISRFFSSIGESHPGRLCQEFCWARKVVQEPQQHPRKEYPLVFGSKFEGAPLPGWNAMFSHVLLS